MPQTIQVPGMGAVQFPDGMSDEDIAGAIKKNMPAQQAAPAQPTPDQAPKKQTPWEAIQHVARDPIGYLKHVGQGLKEVAEIPGKTFELGKAGTPPTTEEMIEPAMNLAMLGGVKMGKGMGAPAGEPVGKLPPAVEKIAKAAQPKAVDVQVKPTEQPLTGVPKQPEAPPPEPTPLSPKETVVKHADDLHQLRQSITADKIEVAKRVDAIPKEMQTADVQERMYHKLENPKEVLSPEEQKVFDEVIEPMRKEIQQLYGVAKGKGMDAYVDDPTYAHRVVKGKETRAIKEEGDVSALPQMGTRSLPKTTSALQERKVYALRDETGKATKIVPASSHELGETVGKHTVTQATTREIEAMTGLRYQKSAAVNMADTLVRMRAAVRNIQHLEKITQDPEWLNHAARLPQAGGNAPIPPGWKPSKIPQLRDWAIEPKLRAAFDDYAGDPLISGLDKLRAANRMAVGSLFWNPTPHIENVAGHWLVGRGWDNFTPQGYKSLMIDSAKAIKAVITQDSLYQSLLRHGSGQIYGGVANRNFYEMLGKKFGLEIEKNPERWGKVIQMLGMNKAADLTASIYNASSKVLWAANDMFMTQRVLELERKGLTRLQAIKEAEKHIPNYRIPPQVLNSRFVSQFLQDPLVMEFGRYRYGQFNSYANMVKDLVSRSKTPKERIDAVGNMFMLGLLAYVIYPAISHGIQKLVGDENIKKLKRGPASAVDSIEKMFTGERSFAQWVQSVITLSPVLKEGLQQFGNQDLFTGRPIVQPGEKSKIRQGAQRAEHAAGTLVAPYQQGEQIAKGQDEHGLPREILKQAIGTEDRSEKTRAYIEKLKGGYVPKRDVKAAARRRQQPKGLIEKIPGYLGVDE